MVTWDRVSPADVLRAIKDYDRLGPERFFSEHGFAPTTISPGRRADQGFVPLVAGKAQPDATLRASLGKGPLPPKAILDAAYVFATGQRLGSSDFEGRKTGAVRVLQQLRFTAQEKQHPARLSSF